MSTSKKNNKIVFPKLKLDLNEKNLLQNLKSFTDFLVTGTNNYHPHEISASLFEDVLYDSISKKLHMKIKPIIFTRIARHIFY